MVKNDKQLVTKKYFKETFDKFEKKLDIKFDLKVKAMETRLDQHIDDKLKEWNTKIFNLVDDLAIEIRDGREHRIITSHQITENTRRIEVLEKNYTLARQ